jgi:hypothetical protein
MSLNVTDISNGVSVSGSTDPFNTYIKTQNAGVYNIQFSAQVDKTDAGTDEIWIWVRKNGTNLTDTATSVQLTGNGAHYVAAWNFFVNAAANDYFQLMWYSTDANVRLHAESAFGVVPGIPSLIVTANRVDQFLSNTGSFSGSFTGSLFGTSSWAVSASWAPPGISSYIAIGSVTASVSNTDPTASFRVTSGSNTLLTLTNNGRVVIGAPPEFIDYQLEVSGAIKADFLYCDSYGSIASSLYGTGQLLTGAAYQPVVYLESTWNTTAESRGIEYRVTNIASSGSSKLLNLFVDGASMFNVDRTGSVNIFGNISNLANVYFKGLTTSNQSNVVTINTATGQLYYTASSAIGGGGGASLSGGKTNYNAIWNSTTTISTGSVFQYSSTQIQLTGSSLAVGNIVPSATAGRIDASNDIVSFSTSDQRFKINVKPIENALFKVKQINGVEFDWLENPIHHGNKGHDIGVIAQEIEQVLPEVVTTRDSGYKAVKYDKIVALLIQAIKEQQVEINELKAKINGITE